MLIYSCFSFPIVDQLLLIVSCVSTVLIIYVNYISLGNLPLINEKSETILESLDSGCQSMDVESQSMEVDEENRLEEDMIGDKCGKRLSPNAPTSSPELLQAVKKSRENTEILEKVNRSNTLSSERKRKGINVGIMDNLQVRLTFNLGNTNTIFYYS